MTTASQEITTFGAAPPPPGRPEWIKGRIYQVVTGGVEHRMYFRREDRWKYRPGLVPWWVARQLVGGKVSSTEFTQALDSLLAEGRLIEVRLVRRDRRDAPHLLVEPGRFKVLPRAVAQARGLKEVLQGEPWAKAIERGSTRQPRREAFTPL